MGHDLQAFIAKDDVATLIQSSREFPFFARLPFGLSLVPVDARWIYDEDERIESNYTALGLPDYAMYGEGGLCMEPVVARVGVDHAQTDPILFVKTEWFGGVGGSQAWRFGRSSRIERVSVHEGLLALGVVPRLGEDAWDAVGLHEYRSSDWDLWRRKRDQGLLVHTRTRRSG